MKKLLVFLVLIFGLSLSAKNEATDPYSEPIAKALGFSYAFFAPVISAKITTEILWKAAEFVPKSMLPGINCLAGFCHLVNALDAVEQMLALYTGHDPKLLHWNQYNPINLPHILVNEQLKKSEDNLLSYGELRENFEKGREGAEPYVKIRNSIIATYSLLEMASRFKYFPVISAENHDSPLSDLNSEAASAVPAESGEWNTIMESVETMQRYDLKTGPWKAINSVNPIEPADSLNSKQFFKLIDELRQIATGSGNVLVQNENNAVFHDVQRLRGGGEATIFLAKTSSGNQVVLRLSLKQNAGADAFLGSKMMQLMSKQMEYFPRIYGLIKVNIQNQSPLLVTCMEKVEDDLDDFITKKGGKITRSMVFEELLGDFLMKQQGVLEIQDKKCKNFGLRLMPDRVYVVNEHKFYFKKGLVPVRLDFCDYTYSDKADEPDRCFYVSLFEKDFDDKNLVDSIVDFVKNLHKLRKNHTCLLRVLTDYFANELVGEIPGGAKVFSVTLKTPTNA